MIRVIKTARTVGDLEQPANTQHSTFAEACPVGWYDARMGLFWNLIQQSQISEHNTRADSLEQRVDRLERELAQTRRTLNELLRLLEEHVGKDIDGDGRVG